MLLSEQDKKVVAEAVRKAESLTSGEIVFALADDSGRYPHATLQGALLGALAATAIYLALPLPQTIELVLWTQIISFALFYALLPHLPLRRWLISRRELEGSVQEAAFREFYSRGLYKTREANGVLIYLSCMERQVVVVGDKGIHEKMGDDHWTAVRDQVIEGIGRKQPLQGICGAIDTCGKALADHFPRRPDDINELPDEVIDRTRH
jgi:putative membrane protein